MLLYDGLLPLNQLLYFHVIALQKIGWKRSRERSTNILKFHNGRKMFLGLETTAKDCTVMIRKLLFIVENFLSFAQVFHFAFAWRWDLKTRINCFHFRRSSFFVYLRVDIVKLSDGVQWKDQNCFWALSGWTFKAIVMQEIVSGGGEWQSELARRATSFSMVQEASCRMSKVISFLFFCWKRHVVSMLPFKDH